MPTHIQSPGPDILAQSHCSWCGFDVTTLEAGVACPECGMRVRGVESRESTRAAAFGLTIAIWAAPVLLIGMVALPVLLSLRNDLSPPVISRHVQTITTLPILALLAGLLTAATRGPPPLRGHKLLVAGLVVMMLLTSLTIASVVLWPRNTTGQLGYDANGQMVVSQLRPTSLVWAADWLARFIVPVLFGGIVAWLCHVSRSVGLSVWLAPWPAFILTALAVAVVCWGTWLADELARTWLPMRRTLIQSSPQVTGSAPGNPTSVGVPTGLPTYARWINPSSITAVLYLAYSVLICIGAYCWIVASCIRLRLRMALA